MGDLISAVEEDLIAYKITDVSLREFNGNPRLSTTGTTHFIPRKDLPPFTEWKSISLEKFTNKPQQSLEIIPLQNILNMKLDIYPICTNVKCMKKLTPVPGELLIECPGVKSRRKMLLSKCLCGLTCQLEVAHTPRPLTLTIFPETLSRFF